MLAAAGGEDYRQRPAKDVRVLVVGATGYIGKYVVKELVKRGYNVVAFARERSGVGGKKSADDVRQELAGAGERSAAAVTAAAAAARLPWNAGFLDARCCLRLQSSLASRSLTLYLTPCLHLLLNHPASQMCALVTCQT